VRAEPTIGTELAGRYRLVERLADSPYGPCWRANDAEGPATRVAFVKTARSLDASVHAKALGRFARFGHPNAVELRNHGFYEDMPFLAATMPEGKPLRAWCTEASVGGTLALRDVRALVDQVTQCLAAAHRGIEGEALIHGGHLSTSTWVERRGEVQFVARVGDWGVAWVSAPVEVVPGAGEVATVRDDVFGLGVLLAELLLGETLTYAGDLSTIVERLTRTRPEAHATIVTIVCQCLASSPSERPESMARVRDLIRRAVWTPQEVRATPPPAAPTPPAPPPPPPSASPTRARVVAVHASAPEITPAKVPVSLPVPAPSLAPPPTPRASRTPLAPLAPLAAPPVAEPVILTESAPAAVVAPIEETTTERSLSVSVTSLKLGASRLGLATVTRGEQPSRSFDGPVETTREVQTLSPSSEAITPIEAGATLRPQRSLLVLEHTAVDRVHADMTSSLDVLGLAAAEATETPPSSEPTHAHAAGARSSTLLSLGNHTAHEARGRARVSTAPLEFAEPATLLIGERPLDTLRPSPTPTPSREVTAAAFVEVTTTPGAVAPPVAAPRDVQSITLPPVAPVSTGIPWWIPALGVAVVVALLVVAIAARS
jgi:hypothetical protein